MQVTDTKNNLCSWHKKKERKEKWNIITINCYLGCRQGNNHISLVLLRIKKEQIMLLFCNICRRCNSNICHRCNSFKASQYLENDDDNQKMLAKEKEEYEKQQQHDGNDNNALPSIVCISEESEPLYRVV